MELYTGGAYRTGDLDFVGIVTKDVTEKLEQAGFERHGRHWIHQRFRLLIETPDRNLDSGNAVATIRLGWSSGEQRIDPTRLRSLAARNETTAALDSLVEFARGHRLRKPTDGEIEEWTRKPL